nr:hypothetical protein [uncultured Pseudomonas sp.]
MASRLLKGATHNFQRATISRQWRLFFADSPATKLGLSCIGFVAKKPNWYPAKSVLNSVAAIEQIFAKYKTIITYGGSMGGYAAIKFSRILSATSVISLCPQWSLDRAECDGANPGYQSYFLASMRGMSVTENDLAGKIYLLYDPGHPEDAYHAQKFIDLSKSVNPIACYSCDHQVTPILAGTENLQRIIDYAANQNLAGLCLFTCNIRRNHKTRKKILLLKLSKRHPILLSKIMNGKSINLETKLF